MGDRANFGFKTGENTVFLYGHWAGHEMLAKMARALKRIKNAGREDDPSYATRIGISEIVGEDWQNDLSWGITVNTIDDNEHKIPVFDIDHQTVSLNDVQWNDGKVTLNPIVHFPVDTFIEKYLK